MALKDSKFIGYLEDIREDLIILCIGIKEGEEIEDFDYSKILNTTLKIAEFHKLNSLDKNGTEKTLKRTTFDKNILQMVSDTLTIKTGTDKCDISIFVKDLQKIIMTIISFGISSGDLYSLQSELKKFTKTIRSRLND